MHVSSNHYQSSSFHNGFVFHLTLNLWEHLSVCWGTELLVSLEVKRLEIQTVAELLCSILGWGAP